MRVVVSGIKPKRIKILDRPKRRIDPAIFSAALGAKPVDRQVESPDLIDLAELGSQQIQGEP